MDWNILIPASPLVVVIFALYLFKAYREGR